MNKVVTINLHGRAYQLEEPGYEKLRQYLDEAAGKLQNDPDKEEIIADLEQAIGEKLGRFVTNSKTVVMENEVEEVLKEMGPVQSSSQAETNQETPKTAPAAKRLYKIREGAMVSGVCMGLAAYFNWDVTLVRILFVLLILLTHGFGLLLYILLAIILPAAKTSAEQAAAFGEPFTAQEFVSRAREEFSRFKSKDKSEWKKWRREFRQQLRDERRQWRDKRRASRGAGAPFFGMLIAVISIFWVIGLVYILKGAIFGLAFPAFAPVWVAVLVWVCIYLIISWPLRAALLWGRLHRCENGRPCRHYHAHIFGFVGWLALIVLAVWFAWHYVPAAHPFLQKANLWYRHVLDKIRG